MHQPSDTLVVNLDTLVVNLDTLVVNLDTLVVHLLYHGKVNLV